VNKNTVLKDPAFVSETSKFRKFLNIAAAAALIEDGLAHLNDETVCEIA